MILDLFSAKYIELIFTRDSDEVECYESHNNLCLEYEKLCTFIIEELGEDIDEFFESGGIRTLIRHLSDLEGTISKNFGKSLKLIPEIYMDDSGKSTEVVILIIINWDELKSRTISDALNLYIENLVST